MASSDADVISIVQAAVRSALRPHLDRFLATGYFPPLVVAVSGGADSLALLDALVAVVPDPQHRLLAGHVDHQLRPASNNDAEYVSRAAHRLGVPCNVETVDVATLAKSERIGIEAAARLARYRSLAKLADCALTDVVVTGHTQDDSVETILLHLLRGSGTRGLGGIGVQERLGASWLGRTEDRPSGLAVLRPLLTVGRAETVAYCEARGITFLTDETNADPRFLRNRVRSHLLPVMRTYNPSIDRTLIRMATVMREEDGWLAAEASQRWTQIIAASEQPNVLSLTGWRRQPSPFQRRIARQLASLMGVDELGYDAIERALAVGAEGGPPRADLGSGLTVERRGDTLTFNRSHTNHEESR